MVYKIKDAIGRDYIIEDINSFAKHIFEYHSCGKSLHQENGHDFIIDDILRQKILDFVKSRKQINSL